MKLESMTDYILGVQTSMIKKPNEPFNKTLSRRGELIESIFKYAKFLKQPLELGMFVRCTVNGKPYGEPTQRDMNLNVNIYSDGENDYIYETSKVYQQAKERVLFEGIEIITNSDGDDFISIKGTVNYPMIDDFKDGKLKRKIESIVGVTLTKSAQKQIGI